MKRFHMLGMVLLLGFVMLPFAQNPEEPMGDRDRENRPPRIEPGRIGIDKPALPPPRLLDIGRLRAMMKDIGINEASAKKIAALTAEFNTLLDKKLIAVQREELNIKEEILNGNPDMKVIEPIIKRKALIIADIEIAQVKRDISIRALLTEEEFEKWKTYLRQAPNRPEGAGQKGK